MQAIELSEDRIVVYDPTGAARILILEQADGTSSLIFLTPSGRRVGGLVVQADYLNLLMGDPLEADHTAAVSINAAGHVYLGQLDDQGRPRVLHPLLEILAAQELLAQRAGN